MSTSRLFNVSTDVAYCSLRKSNLFVCIPNSAFNASSRRWWSDRSDSSVVSRSETSPTLASSERIRLVYAATSIAKRLLALLLGRELVLQRGDLRVDLLLPADVRPERRSDADERNDESERDPPHKRRFRRRRAATPAAASPPRAARRSRGSNGRPAPRRTGRRSRSIARNAVATARRSGPTSSR